MLFNRLDTLGNVLVWERLILILSGETSLRHLRTSGEVQILLLDVSVYMGIIFRRLESKETVRKYHNFIVNISNRIG